MSGLGGHLRVRFATEKDASEVQAIYAPVVRSSAISFEVEVPSVEEMANRIVERQRVLPFLVAEDDVGRVLGYSYGSPFAPRAAYAWSVETSVYVAEGSRGKGVGAQLYGVLLELLSAQGYCHAMAGVTLPNPASVALHESSGFGLVGIYRAVGWKLGAWHDVARWQRSLIEMDGPPPDPVPLDALPEARIHQALDRVRETRRLRL